MNILPNLHILTKSIFYTEVAIKDGVSRNVLKNKIWTYRPTKVILLRHHLWASVHVQWWLCMETHRPLCLYFDCCFGFFGTFLGGEGVCFPQQMAACRRNKEHHRTQWLDAVQTGESYECKHSARKENIALLRWNSKRIKLISELEWVLVQLSDALENKRRGWEERCNGPVGV